MVVMSTNGYCIKLGIIKNLVIIVNSLAAAVLFNGSVCSFGDYVTKILDNSLITFHISRNMSTVCNISATD